MTDYKVGDYIKDRQYGDIYEITEISGKKPLSYVKISKKFDKESFKPVGYIFNCMCNYQDLGKRYSKSPVARLLLQSKIAR